MKPDVYTDLLAIVVDNDFVNDVRVTNQAQLIAESGIPVRVFAFPSKNTEYPGPNISIDPIPSFRGLKDKIKPLMNLVPIYEWWWTYHLKKKIGQHQGIFAIHVHDLYMAKAVKKAIGEKAIRLVLDLHENYPVAIKQYKWATKGFNRYLVRPGLWKRKEKEYLAYADYVIVLSSFFKETLQKKYPFLHDRNVIVLPNVQKVKKTPPSPDKIHRFFQSEDLIFGYFGVISKRRGILFFIDALLAGFERNPKWPVKFLLVGPIDKNERHLFAPALEKGIKSGILIHIPWIELSELNSYFGGIDVCISPLEKNDQHESGVANKLFQYMELGKPILASDCEPQKRLIEKSGCGWVYSWNSQSDLLDKIDRIVESKPDFFEIGDRGKAKIREEYNLETQGQVLIQLYNELRARAHS